MNPPSKHRGQLAGQDYVETLTRAVVHLEAAGYTLDRDGQTVRIVLLEKPHVEALMRAAVTLHEGRTASDKVRGAQPDE